MQITAVKKFTTLAPVRECTPKLLRTSYKSLFSHSSCLNAELHKICFEIRKRTILLCRGIRQNLFESFLKSFLCNAIPKRVINLLGAVHKLLMVILRRNLHNCLHFIFKYMCILRTPYELLIIKLV